MNAETRTLVRSALDASEYTRGAQQVAAANEGMASSGEAVVRTTERATVALREGGGAIDRLQRSLDTTYRAQQQFERAQSTINGALERGAISQQRATQLITLAQQRYQGAGTAAQALATANDNAARGSGRLGQAMGQAGFQIQDFATQVAMGQNALVAFGVQFAQFAGIFGAAGAIAGAIVTVGILTARLLGMGSAAEEAKKAQDTLAAATRAANTVMETQSESAARQDREQRTAAVSALAAARAIIAQAQAVRALRLAELSSTEDQVRLARELGGEDTPLSEAVMRRYNEAQRLRGELALAAAEFQRLDEQVRSATTATSGADRDKAEREARQARERQEREAQQAAERRARELEAIDQRTHMRVQNAVQRAEEEERRATERAREAQEREDARALEQREAANRRTTDDIVKYGADAFADMFEQNGRGWSGMLSNFLQTFRRLMARMAAEAIIRPIIEPIVSGLGLGGATGSAAGGAAGGLGSITNLLGLSGLGSQVSGALGFGGSAFGGIGGSLANFANTPLWGGNVAGPAFNGIAASGAPTIGGILGGAGLGFGAGMLLNSLVGGKSTGGMIGSGGGALAGAVIGSIIPGIGTVLGGLLGGTGGGLLGGLFGGGGASNKEGNATYDLATGSITVGGQDGNKYSAENRSAASAAAQQIAAVVSAIATTLGAKVSGGAFTVGVGDRDGIFGRIDGRDIYSGGRDDASVAKLTSKLVQELLDGLEGGLAGKFRGALNKLGADAAPEAIASLANLVKVVDDLAHPTTAWEQQLAALNAQFDPLIKQAQQLRYGEDALTAARDKALKQLREARQQSLADIRWNIHNRLLRITGRGDRADDREFDRAAEDQMEAMRAQLEALGATAEVTARRIAELTEVQNLEREAMIREREEEAARVIAQNRETLRSLGADINGFLGRLNTTDAGGFSPVVQLANARAAFDSSLAGARLNDVDALRRITGDADALLGSARDVYASGRGFTALRDYVTQALSGLDAAELARASSTSSLAFDANSVAALDALRDSNEALQDRFDRLIEIMEGIEATNARMAYNQAPTPVGARG